jgi:hypothetical protein
MFCCRIPVLVLFFHRPFIGQRQAMDCGADSLPDWNPPSSGYLPLGEGAQYCFVENLDDESPPPASIKLPSGIGV